MKILIIYGTRPEYLKLKKIIELGNFKSLHIKQHSDIINFGNPDFILDIENKTDRLNSVFSNIFYKLPEIIKDFDSILIQGDTATVCASALCAFNLRKKIIYLESGLRTYDLENPFPEEGYRQMVARIADINLCPTELSKKNLLNEFIFKNIHVVGNTSLDNLLEYKNKISYSNKILVTLHRNENIPIIHDWIKEIEKAANIFDNFEFIFPSHPNPIIKSACDNICRKVKVTKSLEHSELLDILSNCRFVITDSGGIQEEASFLNKKTIVCRKYTERIEGIESGHSILCEDPILLIDKIDNIIENYKINKISPYGDGQSSERVLKLINE